MSNYAHIVYVHNNRNQNLKNQAYYISNKYSIYYISIKSFCENITTHRKRIIMNHVLLYTPFHVLPVPK